MAKQSWFLEKESARFAAKDMQRRRPGYSNIHEASATNMKLPEMDKVLENTLVSTNLAKSLTKREMQILKLIVAGKTNKKIAQELYRSERTIEYHRNSLIHKLGVHNTADLVKRAIAAGIVS